jgi:hypothetical protein
MQLGQSSPRKWIEYNIVPNSRAKHSVVTLKMLPYHTKIFSLVNTVFYVELFYVLGFNNCHIATLLLQSQQIVFYNVDKDSGRNQS